MTDSNRPAPLSAVVSDQMKWMPWASSGPEIAIRKRPASKRAAFSVELVEAAGARPGIAFTWARTVALIDGCFSAFLPKHRILPKKQSDGWRAKLTRNVERCRKGRPSAGAWMDRPALLGTRKSARRCRYGGTGQVPGRSGRRTPGHKSESCLC